MSGFFRSDRNSGFFSTRSEEERTPRRVFGRRIFQSPSLQQEPPKPSMEDVDHTILEAQQAIEEYETKSKQPDFEPVTIETFLEEVSDSLQSVSTSDIEEVNVSDLVAYEREFERERDIGWTRSKSDHLQKIVSTMQLDESLGLKSYLLINARVTKEKEKQKIAAEQKALDELLALRQREQNYANDLRDNIKAIFSARKWNLEGTARFGDIDLNYYLQKFKELKDIRDKYESKEFLGPRPTLEYLESFVKEVQLFLKDIYYRLTFTKAIYDSCRVIVNILGAWLHEKDASSFLNLFDRRGKVIINFEDEQKISLKTRNRYFVYIANIDDGVKLAEKYPHVFIHVNQILDGERKLREDKIAKWLYHNHQDQRIIITYSKKIIKYNFQSFSNYFTNTLKQEGDAFIYYRSPFVYDGYRICKNNNFNMFNKFHLFRFLCVLDKNIKIILNSVK